MHQKRPQLEADEAGFELVETRPFGGTWLLDQLWQELRVAKVLEELARRHRFAVPFERLILAMVVNRALDPRSKLGVEEWVAEDALIQVLKAPPVRSKPGVYALLVDLRSGG